MEQKKNISKATEMAATTTKSMATGTVKSTVTATAKSFVPDDRVYYTKKNVSLKEYKIHAYVYDLRIVNVPKIIHYNKKTKEMIMVKVGTINVSDYYGELAENISKELFARIRGIIRTLYEHNILYIDITGYNFIENANKIWIIDFEHATYNPKRMNKFVEEFLDGKDAWNPAFM
jgi:tRNA A-37 threonylcarbamoyl transferase component Bud32